VTEASLGDRIREIRLRKGMQQMEAARRTGIHFNSWYRYEKGLVMPKAPMLERIARGLGVSVGELFGEEDVVPFERSGEQELSETLHKLAERAGQDTRRIRSSRTATDDMMISVLMHRCTYQEMADFALGKEPYPPTYRDSDVVRKALDEYGDAVSELSHEYQKRVEAPPGGVIVELFSRETA
jgi:transcriptional regulator with XRE-family HTH domain